MLDVLRFVENHPVVFAEYSSLTRQVGKQQGVIDKDDMRPLGGGADTMQEAAGSIPADTSGTIAAVRRNLLPETAHNPGAETGDFPDVAGARPVQPAHEREQRLAFSRFEFIRLGDECFVAPLADVIAS